MKAISSSTISRIVRLGLMILIQGLYLPLNRGLSGGTLSRIWLDDYVPTLPAWTVPYILWLPLCLFFTIWAAWKMPEQLFRAYFASAMFTISSSMLFFYLFPTYVQRPEVIGSDVFSQMLRGVYQNDQLYNAFPSGHVYLVVSVAMYYLAWRSSRAFSLRSIRWESWRTWFWIGMIVIISLSTIFTGQHSMIDIPGGMLVAIVGYLFGRWWANKTGPSGAYEPQTHP